MEVLGAVSAAMQLASQSLEALQIIQKIKSGGKVLKAYQDQLESLRQISHKIEQNPLLHTKEVISEINSILAIIEKQDLSTLLGRGRLYRGLAFVLKERSLIEQSFQLERRKLTLILTITERDSSTLHEILVGMSVSSSQIPTVQAPPSAFSSQVMVCKGTTPDSGPLVQANQRVPRKSRRKPQFQGYEGRPSHPDDEPMNSNKYSNNTASRNTNQTNGAVYLGDNKTLLGSDIFISTNYKKNRKVGGGGGVQLNGVRIEHSGDLTSHPKITGMEYDGNEVVEESQEGREPAADARDIKRTEQINGTLLLGNQKMGDYF